MIDWISVILLIVLGIALIITEIVFVPGVTLVGLAGVFFLGVGVVMSYMVFGNETGLVVLSVTALAGITATWVSFRGSFWKKFALKETISSRVNEEIETLYEVGQTGITLSVLRPAGNAEFEKGIVEVSCLTEMVQPNTKVRIIKIEKSKIIVEPIN